MSCPFHCSQTFEPIATLPLIVASKTDRHSADLIYTINAPNFSTILQVVQRCLLASKSIYHMPPRSLPHTKVPKHHLSTVKPSGWWRQQSECLQVRRLVLGRSIAGVRTSQLCSAEIYSGNERNCMYIRWYRQS